MDILSTIILTAIGSTGLFTFLQFLIKRKDNKNEEIQGCNERFLDLDSRLDKMEKDSCRTQLLLLMKDFSDNVQEILILAEHYFVTLKGDWYMTNIFSKWLTKNKITIPSWFINKE